MQLCAALCNSAQVLRIHSISHTHPEPQGLPLHSRPSLRRCPPGGGDGLRNRRLEQGRHRGILKAGKGKRNGGGGLLMKKVSGGMHLFILFTLTPSHNPCDMKHMHKGVMCPTFEPCDQQPHEQACPSVPGPAGSKRLSHQPHDPGQREFGGGGRGRGDLMSSVRRERGVKRLNRLRQMKV